MPLNKTIDQWSLIEPKAIAEASPAHIQNCIADAQHDINTLSKENDDYKHMLSRIAYPRRGTPDEIATIFDFATEIQAIHKREDLE